MRKILIVLLLSSFTLLGCLNENTIDTNGNLGIELIKESVNLDIDNDLQEIESYKKIESEVFFQNTEIYNINILTKELEGLKNYYIRFNEELKGLPDSILNNDKIKNINFENKDLIILVKKRYSIVIKDVLEYDSYIKVNYMNMTCKYNWDYVPSLELIIIPKSDKEIILDEVGY